MLLRKDQVELSWVMHACILNSPRVRADTRGSRVQGYPGLYNKVPVSKTQENREGRKERESRKEERREEGGSGQVGIRVTPSREFWSQWNPQHTALLAHCG